MKPWRIPTAVLGISLLWAPALLAGQAAPPNGNTDGIANNGPVNGVVPGPGTVNYVEGAVYLDGKPLGKNSVGTAQMTAGQQLQTHQGKAEILLNPGIYLRVGDHSTVKMISPYITPSKVEVLRGEVGVEVDQLLKQNVVQVVDRGVTTQLVKTGYYEFNANDGQARVFSGQAEVEYAPNKWQKVKGQHQLTLIEGAKSKESKFHADPQEDALMQWSKLRSQYLAEANQQMAPQYYGPGFDPGWYWDPYMWNYTFIGGGPFSSPFGWGFYPLGWGWGGMGWGGGWGWGGPGWGWGGPGWGWGGGFYGRGYGGGYMPLHRDFDHDHDFRGGQRLGSGGVGHFQGSPGFHGGAGSFRGGAGSFHGGRR